MDFADGGCVQRFATEMKRLLHPIGLPEVPFSDSRALCAEILREMESLLAPKTREVLPVIVLDFCHSSLRIVLRCVISPRKQIQRALLGEWFTSWTHCGLYFVQLEAGVSCVDTHKRRLFEGTAGVNEDAENECPFVEETRIRRKSEATDPRHASMVYPPSILPFLTRTRFSGG